jgi:beta-glucosidase-like glycosyl hydrolase
MTVAFVRGVQHHPDSNTQLLTTAMLKDWVVYNLESSQPVGGGDWQYRDKYNAVVSDADLRQSFMPAFEAGAVEGGARSMMTSYHALNGVPSTAHPMIQSELRERLDWQGMMMSDGGVSRHATPCHAMPCCVSK